MNIEQAIGITVQERLERDHETEGNQANPDFYRMALELDYLSGLSEMGWWADWGGCMYAETIIRDFGPLVAEAAKVCETGGDWIDGTKSVLSTVSSYLDWQAHCASSDDEIAVRLITDIAAAVKAFSAHLATDPE